MSMNTIAQALRRVEAVLQRRPETGMHEDPPASSEWRGGMRFVVSHPNGLQVSTDMAVELGGTGDQVSPGWLFRAGLASCAATSVLMAAASAGVEITLLQVKAESRSDSRGVLGMQGADGQVVYGGPGDVTLKIRIGAQGVDAAQLRALVEKGIRQSPVPNAVAHVTPIDLQIDIATH